MPRIRQLLSGYTGIAAAMGVFLLGSYGLWQWTQYKDIGGNLFAGAIQLIFTFVIFDRLISMRNERSELPRRLSAYEDTCVWFNQICHFYQGAHRHANVPKTSTVAADFFTKDFFREVLRMDLDQEAPILPKRTGWQWVAQQSLKFTEDGRGIIERDGDRLPPAVCRAIHLYCRSGFLACQRSLLVMKQVNQLFPQYPRPATWLYNSVSPSDEEIEALRTIYLWLNEFHESNKEHTPTLVKATLK